MHDLHHTVARWHPAPGALANQIAGPSILTACDWWTKRDSRCIEAGCCGAVVDADLAFAVAVAMADSQAETVQTQGDLDFASLGPTLSPLPAQYTYTEDSLSDGQSRWIMVRRSAPRRDQTEPNPCTTGSKACG